MKIVRHMNFILESYLNILIFCQVSQVVEDADLEVEELGASIRVTGPNSSGGAWDKSGDQQPAEPPQSDNNQFVAVEHTDHKDDADEESHVIPSGSPEKRPVEEAGLPPSVSFIDQVSGRGGSATCSLYIYQSEVLSGAVVRSGFCKLHKLHFIVASTTINHKFIDHNRLMRLLFTKFQL